MPAKLPLSARLPASLGQLLDWAAPACAAWCWGRAVAVAPRSAELHFARAQALARCARWREAARSYAMASHLAPANVEYQGSLVLALERTGATEAALDALRRFADLRPGDGEVHVLIGTLQRRCGRAADALRSFRLAVALGRPPLTRRFLLGEMMLGVEHWEEALAALGLARETGAAAAPHAQERSALNFLPRRPPAPSPAQARRGGRLRALLPRLCMRALTARAGRAVLCELRNVRAAIAHRVAREQRLRAMRRAAREVRGVAPRRAAVHLLVGGLLSWPALAAGQASPAGEPARRETAAGREQARLCERLRGEEGARACRAALALGIARSRQRAIRQQLALHLVALESWDELAELYRDAVRLDPDDAQAWRRLGTTQLHALGAPVEAVGALREAVRLAPGDAEAHVELGVALAGLGRFPEAAAEMERAHALDAAVLDGRPAARAILEAARQGRRWP